MSVLITIAADISASYHMAEAAGNYERHALSYILEFITGLLTLGAGAVAIEAVHD